MIKGNSRSNNQKVHGSTKNEDFARKSVGTGVRPYSAKIDLMKDESKKTTAVSNNDIDTN